MSQKSTLELTPLATCALVTAIIIAFCGIANATTYQPTTNAEFQSALDSAVLGDEIVLASNLTFTGPFLLRNRPAGSGEIVIRSSQSGSLPAGVRVSPGNAASMPKILTGNFGEAAFISDTSAHQYHLIGLEIEATQWVYNVVLLGDGSETSTSMLPHDMVIDRCYIHGEANLGSRRGVAANGANIQVLNSYLSDFKEVGGDSQAILTWNGTGPILIQNNYLEGAGENVMFGGTDPKIQNLIPTDIYVYGNYFYKPPKWRPGSGDPEAGKWVVKNLFELKSAHNVHVEGNTFENNWAQQNGQNGFGILFTTRNQDGTAPWVQVSDVYFFNNILRNSARGFSILGYDNNYPSQQTTNINIRHNKIYNIGDIWGDGWAFQVLDGTADVHIEHNTILETCPSCDGVNTGSRILYASVAPGKPLHTGFVFRDNIINNGQYSVTGDGTTGANTTFATFFTSPIFTNNVIIGATTSWQSQFSNYPGQFFEPDSNSVGFVDAANFDLRLAPSSPYKNRGTDGNDLGYNPALTINKIGAGTGSVTTSPAGVACGTECQFTEAHYSWDTSVTLTASPDAGMSFSAWGGDGCSGTANTCTVTMNQGRTITAEFEPGTNPNFNLTVSPTSSTVVQGGSTTYTVSVSAVNGFAGTVSLSSTGFGSGAGGSFNPTSISGSGSSTLTVTATGTAQTGTFNLTITGTSGSLTHQATVTLNVTPSVTTYTLTVTPTSTNGSITSNDSPQTINCESPCSHAYPAQTQVTLTANPHAGYIFSSWGGACSGPATTCLVTMDADKSVAATFTPQTGTFATDDFNRADGPLGSNWTNQAPGYTDPGAIRSNTVGTEDQFSSRRADRYTAVTFSGDHYSQVYVSVLPALTAGAAVRMQSNADSYYAAGFDNNSFSTADGSYKCRIWRYDNNHIATSLAVDATCHIVAGDTLRLEAQGSTLRFYKNGVLKLTATDTSYTGGAPGFEFMHNASGLPVLDNWAGGNLVANSATADDFNRPDGPLGSNWTNQAPGATDPGAIRSNTVGMEDQFTSRRADWYNAITFSGDHYSQVYVSVLPALTAGAAVRMQPNTDSYYAAGFDNNSFSTGDGSYKCRIWRYDNNHIATSLAVDATCHIAAGDTLRLEAQGSTLRFYQNGVLKLTASDTSYTGGAPGFEFMHNVNGSPVLDNWAGGNLVANSATDNFNRADGPLGSNWANQAPGSTDPGAIRSNTVGMEDQFTSRRADRYTAVTFRGDHYSQVYVSVLPALTAGAAVRMQPTADSYYAAGFDNNSFSTGDGSYKCRIWRYDNNHIATSLAVDATCHIAAGDTLRLEVQGAALRFYQNGVLKLTATDTSYTGGAAGFEFMHNVNNSPVLDNWAGGDLTQ